jgi:dipeptidyl aminopeptidase/acylaminoacyl peptidase
MVTGKRAFEGKSTASLISAILKDEPKPISELQPLTPPSFERLVRVSLAKDPDERWQSAHDVMAELRWIGETGRQAVAASGARRRGPGRLAVAGLAFLLGAAIVGSAFLVRGRDAEPVRFLNVGIPAEHDWEFNAGWLLYARAATVRQRALVWVDASGASVPAVPERHGFLQPSLSPDGRRLAIVIYDGLRNDLWTAELGRQPLTRLTFEATIEGGAVWSPDGTRIAFGSEDGLYWKRVDGSGRPNRVATDSGVEPSAWSPDGRRILFTRVGPKAGSDVWAAPAEGDGAGQPVLTSSFNEFAAVFSPDGRRLAYVSDETGRHEVYVQSFPPSGGKWQISTGGRRGAGVALERSLLPKRKQDDGSGRLHDFRARPRHAASRLRGRLPAL